MLSTRDRLQNYGHIQTESEGMKTDIKYKWKSKEREKQNMNKEQGNMYRAYSWLGV